MDVSDRKKTFAHLENVYDLQSLYSYLQRHQIPVEVEVAQYVTKKHLEDFVEDTETPSTVNNLPIILLRRDNILSVFDGTHRLVNAYRRQKTTISAYTLSSEQFDKYIQHTKPLCTISEWVTAFSEQYQ